MKNMLKLVEFRQNELEKHPLCHWMSDKAVPPKERLSFVPSMLYFVMGFKDILENIKTQSPQNNIETLINIHCEEDLDHWKWYLKDIEKLGFNIDSWGSSSYDVFKKLWGDELYAPRKMVYESIRYARNAKDPALKLLLIEVMEAAFGSFIKYMIHPLKETELYEHLEYFGHTHEHVEDNHSLGSWTGDQSPEEFIENILIPENLVYEARAMVEHLFDLFETMFTSWHQSCDFFEYTHIHANQSATMNPIQSTNPIN